MAATVDIRKGTLTDKSEVFDVIVYDFDEPEEESRICIPCKDEVAAIALSLLIEQGIEEFGV